LSASEAHAAVQRGLSAGLLAEAVIARAYAVPRTAALPAREPAPRLTGAYAAATSRKLVETRTNLDSAAIVNHRNLAEFALHGAKYAFAPERLPIGPGVPTSHASPAFAGVFAAGHEPLAWPHAQGEIRGEGLRPLHPCVPGAALRDAALYELLALFDALRAGRARERGIASSRLQTLIDPAAPGAGTAAATNDSTGARRG